MMRADDFNPPEKLYLLPPKDVAEGLTGMDAELLERISPDEIRDGAWMKRGEKVRSQHWIVNTMIKVFIPVSTYTCGLKVHVYT